MFGVLWIGLAMVHAIWLRELVIEQDGETIATGMGLVFDVLIATFLGDTVAYFVGRAYGRTQLAPLISPNKTLEGLVGGVVGGTLAFWCAGLYQDWLTGWDALLIGFLVAIAAPMGDLFESLIKRDLEVKDTGRLFGAHGGVLDRLDAVLLHDRGAATTPRSASGYGDSSARTAAARRTSPARAWPASGRPPRRSGRRTAAPAGSTSSASRRAKSGTLSLNVTAGEPSTPGDGAGGAVAHAHGPAARAACRCRGGPARRRCRPRSRTRAWARTGAPCR